MTYNRLKEIIEKAKDEAMSKGYIFIMNEAPETFFDEDGNEYFDSNWHSGAIFTLAKDALAVEVVATGDIRAHIFNSDDEILMSFTDKSNSGRFREEMEPYVKGDKELYKKVTFSNNNWYEVLLYFEGEYLADYVLECDIYEELIQLSKLISWAEDTVSEELEERKEEFLIIREYNFSSNGNSDIRTKYHKFFALPKDAHKTFEDVIYDELDSDFISSFEMLDSEHAFIEKEDPYGIYHVMITLLGNNNKKKMPHRKTAEEKGTIIRQIENQVDDLSSFEEYFDMPFVNP